MIYINPDKIHLTATTVTLPTKKKTDSKYNLSNTGTKDAHTQIDLKRCETQSITKSHTIKQLDFISNTDISITATDRTNSSINRI